MPDNVHEVAWYEFGAVPGSPGSAVLAAHVDLAGYGAGVFFRLEELEPGDLIEVGFDEGPPRRFRVEARTIYQKDELPLGPIFAGDGEPALTLVTCGGGFSDGRYDSNVVVFALPVATPHRLPLQ